jgi:hypothetical protein
VRDEGVGAEADGAGAGDALPDEEEGPAPRVEGDAPLDRVPRAERRAGPAARLQIQEPDVAVEGALDHLDQRLGRGAPVEERHGAAHVLGPADDGRLPRPARAPAPPRRPPLGPEGPGDLERAAGDPPVPDGAAVAAGAAAERHDPLHFGVGVREGLRAERGRRRREAVAEEELGADGGEGRRPPAALFRGRGGRDARLPARRAGGEERRRERGEEPEWASHADRLPRLRAGVAPRATRRHPVRAWAVPKGRSCV